MISVDKGPEAGVNMLSQVVVSYSMKDRHE